MRIRVRARADSKKGRGDLEGNKPPVLALVHQNDGRIRFLVCKDLEDADQDIAEYGVDSVILCTNNYLIYDGIGQGGMDGHLAVTHSDTYVIGDAHTNPFEHRYSFLRQWLAKFRGVLKHHLQRHLNFLGLLLNDDTDWFSRILSYESSE